jgi:hypothetical protein
MVVGTKVHRGVDGTGTAVGWRHGVRPRRRSWSVFRSLLFTQEAQWGFCVSPAKGLGSRERLRLGLIGGFSMGFLGQPSVVRVLFLRQPHLQMEFLELSWRHLVRRPHEQILRILVHRKGDDFADVGLIG